MSSVLKMLSDAEESRKIRAFPKPYSPNITPYMKIGFSQETREICEGNRATLTSLKICKVIVLGDVCVGKTCIVNRFCHQIFESNYKATIGVDFEVEKFEILGIPFNLQIWDTAGQERFKCIAQAYYRSSHVIVVVFDLSNVSTLANCKTWINEALNANPNVDPYIFLVGTKKDLLSKASYKVMEGYAAKVAKNLRAEYWCCSAKTGENIQRLFLRIAALAFDYSIAKECEMGNAKFIGTDLVSLKRNQSKIKKEQSGCGSIKCND